MGAQGLFTAVVAVSLLNGLNSPMLAVAWHLHPVWMPEMVPITPETVFYGASLMVATGTLLLAAVPAAIAERLFGASERGALAVWLAAAVALLLLGLR